MNYRIKWTKALEDDLWDLHCEHPGKPARWLADEMGLPWKAVDNRLYKLRCEREEKWLEHAKIGCFDIESSDLKANVGHLISWALYLPDGEVQHDLIRREEMAKLYPPDRRIVASAVKAIEQMDLLVTYYGTGFDIPFLRSRALEHGIHFPVYGAILHVDLYYAQRSLLKLSNGRMGTVGQFLGTEDKDHYDVRVWNRARAGNAEALQHILEHNISDVKITSEIFMALAPYRKWTRRSI